MGSCAPPGPPVSSGEAFALGAPPQAGRLTAQGVGPLGSGLCGSLALLCGHTGLPRASGPFKWGLGLTETSQVPDLCLPSMTRAPSPPGHPLRTQVRRKGQTYSHERGEGRALALSPVAPSAASPDLPLWRHQPRFRGRSPASPTAHSAGSRTRGAGPHLPGALRALVTFGAGGGLHRGGLWAVGACWAGQAGVSP